METATEHGTGLTAQVLQENLALGLDAIRPAVPTRPDIPILSNVHISSDRGRLRLVATDLDTWIVARVGAKIDFKGAITVPCASLHKQVKASPAAVVALRATSATTLDMECARATTSLAGLPANHYPIIPESDPEAPAILIDGRSLADAVKYIEKSVATIADRPNLMHVYVEASASGVTITGSDGFRLAHRRLIHANAPAEYHGTYLIPLNALQLAAKLAVRNKNREVVAIRVIGHGRVTLGVGCGLGGHDLEVFAKLSTDTYPDYPKLLLDPSEPGAIVTFKRDAMQTMIKRAVAATECTKVAVAAAPDGITINATAPSGGGATFCGSIDTTITRQGPETTPWDRPAFNPKYLLDMLAVADETVRAQFPVRARQAMFYSEHGYHLIMPMFNARP